MLSPANASANQSLSYNVIFAYKVIKRWPFLLSILKPLRIIIVTFYSLVYRMMCTISLGTEPLPRKDYVLSISDQILLLEIK